MKKTNKKNYEFGKKNQNVNLNAYEQKLVEELNKGTFQCCDGQVTFHPTSVTPKLINGSKAVVVNWHQETEMLPGLKVPIFGTTGFYVAGNELKVINFDSNSKPMFDIAGAVVEAIAIMSGTVTNYNRKDPDTFKVVYI